jgi:hypothetical protein
MELQTQNLQENHILVKRHGGPCIQSVWTQQPVDRGDSREVKC